MYKVRFDCSVEIGRPQGPVLQEISTINLSNANVVKKILLKSNFLVLVMMNLMMKKI